MSNENVRKLAGRVLIVGGGVGGMAVAIRLAEAGVTGIDLIDSDPKWGVYGTGITLSMLTLRAFGDLGFAPQLMTEGNCYDGIFLCDNKGNLLRDIAAPRLFSPDVPGEGGVLRPVLHAMMKKKVTDLGIKARLGITIESYAQDESGVDVVFSDGSQGRYDLVIGADGLFSKTRALTFPDAPKPRFTGQACWRVLFDIPEGWEKGRMFLGEKVKVGFSLCSPNKMYMYLLEHVPDNPWRNESEFPAILRRLMDDFQGPVAELRDQINDKSHIVYRPLEALLLTDTWTKGRVALLGDAAHATTPHLGSGAGAAVEDAIVLVEELGRAGSIDEAFEAYNRRRIPRASVVVNNSLRLGELEMASAPMSEQAAIMGASLAAIAEPYR
ncbi:FAD-dependent monooxygenase [Rhizobium alvei]|uniref:FAD-dependent monooxygenase n=1 Tax=Rhizobium alvei TaxID=1132659 RepID=A0ABT8YRM7_9HYPH|nr:FAD-dependent monooxygenase [Rhizobium alvei]MDO6966372.1 FAD-dependent monooxygenase [Rhizobium alvei]